MGQGHSDLGGRILFEMRLVLSKWANTILGRKKEKKISYQEIKPIHPSSGYRKSQVSEKYEGEVVTLTRKAEVRKDVESFPPASGERDKIRVSEVERVTIIRRIKHYYNIHKILLVGEGDFSFSACLANVFGSAVNMVATSLNSEDFLKKNSGKAMSNINDLKSKGCIVLHGVDATKMSSHDFLKGMKFDRIVFNFPHAGFFNDDSWESQISRHQKLIISFFQNAKKMLLEKGEIQISNKSMGFHLEWNIESLASPSGLTCMKSVIFNSDDYPGYNTKYGFGGDGNFDYDPSKTYMIGL